MVKAGFDKIFVGIETPEESCLAECNKKQNNKRDLIKCVNTIQESGMEVTAGFHAKTQSGQRPLRIKISRSRVDQDIKLFMIFISIT